MQVRRWIDERPNAAMFLHAAHVIDEHARRLGVWRCPLPASDTAVPRDLLLSRLIVQNFIAIPTPVINREAFLAIGGMDSDLWYTADWDLYLKLAAFGDVYYRSDILASFRVHDASQTMTGSRSPDDFRGQMQRVLDRHSPKLSAADRASSLRAARASIDVNVALARVGHGEASAIGSAVVATLSLGPLGVYRYFRDSRIVERLAPRVRARLGREVVMRHPSQSLTRLRPLLGRNFRYIVVGATCAVINNVLLIGLVFAGLSTVTANAISLVPMFFIGYGLHVTVTFDVKPSLTGLLRFSAWLIASLPLSMLILFILVDLLHVSITLAAPIGTVLVFVWNYVATHIAIMKPLNG